MYTINIDRDKLILLNNEFNFIEKSVVNSKSDAISLVQKVKNGINEPVDASGEISITFKKEELVLVKKALSFLAYKVVCQSLGKDVAESELQQMREVIGVIKGSEREVGESVDDGIEDAELRLDD